MITEEPWAQTVEKPTRRNTSPSHVTSSGGGRGARPTPAIARHVTITRSIGLTLHPGEPRVPGWARKSARDDLGGTSGDVKLGPVGWPSGKRHSQDGTPSTKATFTPSTEDSPPCRDETIKCSSMTCKRHILLAGSTPFET